MSVFKRQKNVLQTNSVGILYPNSTTNLVKDKYDNIDFIMSYNDAIKSELVKSILEKEQLEKELLEKEQESICNSDDENNNDKHSMNVHKYTRVTIPDALYEGIRFCDVEKLMNLWVGTDIYFDNEQYLDENDNKIFIYKDVARLSQALLLSEDLPFVRLLNRDFPPST